MNKITRKYLSGEKIETYHTLTTVELSPVGKLQMSSSAAFAPSTTAKVAPAGILENLSSDDIYVKVWDVEQKLNYFFDNLEYRISNGSHELIGCSDKSFTIRHREEDNFYHEETFTFSDNTLSNSLVKSRFDKYIELAKQQYPFYEENAQEELFARNLSNAIYNRTSLDITKLQDIPEFYEFYEEHKDMVEKTLRKRLKEKAFPEWLDLLIRYLTLLTLNLVFLRKQKLPLLIAIDVVLGFAIAAADISIQKAYANSTAEKRMDEGIHQLQNRRLNGYSGFKNKVLKAIKADIELTKYLKFDGDQGISYQEVLRTLYELADKVLNDAIEPEVTNDKTDLMADVLNKLIDIEQIICIHINYNGELNAEMLLKEHQGIPEESNTISIPTDEKRLLFQ